jgi:predicted amidohydrolase
MPRGGEVGDSGALASEVNVALVQTNLDYRQAWSLGPKMRSLEQEHAWSEVRKALHTLRGAQPRPGIIILPELAVPRTRVGNLRRMSAKLDCVLIAGIDYRIDRASSSVRNEAVLLVPEHWQQGRPQRRAMSHWIGKTYPSPTEDDHLRKSGFSFHGSPTLWLFDSGRFGRFGVSICYDFMDLERAVLYKGQVHHLFILAYNRDVESFRCLAEALARTMYCNVVVCNTGFFGGSLAIAPLYTPWERVIYRHDGAGMFLTQVVRLPVADLDLAQRSNGPKRDIKATTEPKFKSLPPGWPQPEAKLAIRREPLPVESPAIAHGTDE